MQRVQIWLQSVQLVVFLGAAVATLRLWWRHRDRPAAFLAGAFGLLGLTLLVNRLLPTADGAAVAVVRDLVVVGLAGFPWLLALFAWSFEPRFPRWLLAAGVAVAGLGLWTFLLPPLPPAGEARSAVASAFVAAFVGVWSVLTITAASKLWRSGGSQPLVRARMRLMASGALVLTAALLIAGLAPTDPAVWTGAVTTGLTIVSALLFLAGFVPPRALRVWWRRRATAQWQQMQLRLIAATTPRQAAEAVVPVLADLLGGGAAVVDADGVLLAHARMDRDDAQAAADRIKTGEPSAPTDELVAVNRSWIVVRPTIYTPLFGADERDLLSGFAIQLRFALERAELFEANEQARDELKRTGDQIQAMTVGLAHDLRNPTTTISAYVSLLQTARDDEEREELLNGIEASTAYLNQLVDSLVELSRAGSTRQETEPVDVGELVAGIVKRLRVTYPRVKVRQGPLPVIEARRLEMHQVFENLLTNAAKHGGREDLTIEIRQHMASGGVAIDVRDNGCGLHPDDREAVFTPFRRGRRAAGRGSGVGLALVRRIVETYSGDIDLVDEPRGSDPVDPGAPADREGGAAAPLVDEDSSGAHFRIRFPASLIVPRGDSPDPV